MSIASDPKNPPASHRPLTIATWNVNSINVRLPHLLDFLNEYAPDCIGLQELKCTDDNFPRAEIEAAGYTVSTFGQKAYNGVAILSKKPPLNVTRGFLKPEDMIDQPEEARFILATFELKPGVNYKVASVYVPNGQALTSPKFDYKMRWLGALSRYLKSQVKTTEKFALVGDFNIAPDDRDVYDPVAWQNHIHCSQPERDALKELLNLGLVDTFRMHQKDAGHHSWWDYRQDSYQTNKGLRIDMIYATFGFAKACVGSSIITKTRGWDRPSDHAPVLSQFV